MSSVCVLQSGFVTSSSKNLAKVKPRALSLKEKMLTDHVVSLKETYYHEDIQRLFSAYRKDPSLACRFEFREEVIKIAIEELFKAEGGLVNWIALQLKQRTVGYIHRRFLIDTLRFVIDDKKKSMENYTYYRLTSAHRDPDALETGSDDVQGDLKRIMDSINNAAYFTPTFIVRRWTSDVERFVDMLASLHVIFGRSEGEQDSAVGATDSAT